MNVYVETNFVLELAFQQEQYASCEEILNLCTKGLSRLTIPAYCLAEPHEKLKRQSTSRKELQRVLEVELGQLARTASYTTQTAHIQQDIARLLIQSTEEEKQRFNRYRDRLLQLAEVIPLTHEILKTASRYESAYDLTSQDALVYASVKSHLEQYKPEQSCFLNRNTRDFDTPDIVDDLSSHGCKMIPRFDDGCELIRSQASQ